MYRYAAALAFATTTASSIAATTPKAPDTQPVQAPADSARTVQYHSQDIVAIHAKLKFTTLIVVPPTEKIMEAATGDKDFWVVDVVGSFCFVHPAKQGISSNLNLITDKGNIYSFTLQDISGTTAAPDLKVMIEPADRSSIVASTGPAQYVPAAQVQQVMQQLAAVQSHIGQAVDEYKQAYPLALKFDYTYKGNIAPFDVQSIYHDDKFTYIKTNATEKFSVYEMKDGKPNLINTSVSKEGLGMVAMTSPYLAVVYAITQFMLALLGALIAGIIAYGAIAATIVGLLGPIFIPFMVFEKTEFLFWGWLKAYLSFYFYKVIAAATMSVLGQFFMGYYQTLATGTDITGATQNFPILLLLIVINVFILAKIPAITASIFSGSSAGHDGGMGLVARAF